MTQKSCEYLKEETLIFRYQPQACKQISFATPLQEASIYDEQQYIQNTNVPQDTLKQYFDAQHLLDPIYDGNQSSVYKRAREKLFPLSVRGSKENANRAGDKLAELLDIAGITYDSDHKVRFADVCAAPGAWSIYVLHKYQNARGVGMSMPIEGTSLQNTWYPELQQNQRFKATFGEDGSGNVYFEKNLAEIEKVCNDFFQTEANTPEDNKQVKLELQLCDGGFQIYKNPEGQHCEHLQELITLRLLLSEFMVCLRLLGPGGHFVCKMYDSISLFTQQLLFLMASMFSDFYVVKPAHSRISNAEKYLVFKGFRGINENIESKLKNIYNGYQNDRVYLKIFDKCENYDEFEKFLQQVNEQLLYRCTKSLQMIIEETNKMINEYKQRNNGQSRSNITILPAPTGERMNQRQDNRRFDYYRDDYYNEPRRQQEYSNRNNYREYEDDRNGNYNRNARNPPNQYNDYENRKYYNQDDSRTQMEQNSLQRRNQRYYSQYPSQNDRNNFKK